MIHRRAVSVLLALLAAGCAVGPNYSRPAAEAPPAYVRQLALYRGILAKLYPQRAVRAALLCTESTDLMEISAPALDAELASAAGRDSRA